LFEYQTKAAKIFLSFQAEVVSSQTAVLTDHCLISLVQLGMFIFWQHIEGQIFCISIGHILVSFNVTSLQFPSWRCPFNSKFQNAPWCDACSLHKINTDIHLMCEVTAKGKLYKAECSLSDSNSHFFTNISTWNLVKVSIIIQEQIQRNARISNEKQISKFKQNVRRFRF
jgi:hypothetical protein